MLPIPANPAEHAGHRVYLKGMLLAESAQGLLPDWAFFARCVVDAGELRPTASREALYADSLLDTTRQALGDQLRGWLVGLARADQARLHKFLGVHHLGVKALALHDDDMLRLVEQWWPMETNVGRMTLADFRAQHGEIRYCATADDFRQLAGVAAAQDIALVNGGYTYDTEIIERLPAIEPGLTVARLDPTDLATRFDAVPPGHRAGAAAVPHRRAAGDGPARLRGACCAPSSRPRCRCCSCWTGSAAFQAELRATKRAGRTSCGPACCRAFDKPADDRPQLVLNHRNPLVRRVCRADRPETGRAGRGGAVRAGVALRLPPDPAGRRGAAQPVVPGPARPSRAGQLTRGTV